MNAFTSQIKPSPRFFFPKNGKLFSYSTLSSVEIRSAVQEIDENLTRLANETHYPRAITRLALKRKEYRIGVYSKLGEKEQIVDLRNDLLFFQKEQETSESPYLTFIAVFDDEISKFDSENSFETALKRHLSLLTNEKEPSDLRRPETFCFNFDGLSYSVVGMHPFSSRESRYFSKPILVFNLQEQFEQLDEILSASFSPKTIVKE